MDPPTRQKPSSVPFYLGIVSSFVYLGLIAAYFRWRGWHWEKLTVEQFSNFLQGAFAPLAFFWLVLGYRQQGDELRHSADALWLQGEELRNSVVQQEQLVRAARDQIDLEREKLEAEGRAKERAVLPIMRLISGMNEGLGDDSRRYHFQLINVGHTMRDVTLHVDGVRRASVATLAYQDKVPILLDFKIGGMETKNLVLHGYDALDNYMSWQWKATHAGAAVNIEFVAEAEKNVRFG